MGNKATALRRMCAYYGALKVPPLCIGSQRMPNVRNFRAQWQLPRYEWCPIALLQTAMACEEPCVVQQSSRTEFDIL